MTLLRGGCGAAAGRQVPGRAPGEVGAGGQGDQLPGKAVQVDLRLSPG